MSRVEKLMLLLVATSAVGCGLSAAPVRSSTAKTTIEVTTRADAEADDALVVTRIAHSSLLIRYKDSVLLTDPWFSEKFGYYHGEPLGVGLDQLPRLAAVLSSHGHYDHFDVITLAAYPDKAVPMIVRAGTGQEAAAAGFTNVKELDTWNEANVGAFKITATPAKHPVPQNTYVIQAGGFTVFFGGDTLLTPELDQVARRFPHIDLALVPVNGITTGIFGGDEVVMNPKEAASLCALLHADIGVPIHDKVESGWFAETFFVHYHGTGGDFVAAARELAPSTRAMELESGQSLRLRRSRGE